MRYLIFFSLICINLHASYPELLFNGNCITCHKTNSLNKSAPTIQEIQSEYKNAFSKKEDFVNYMTVWLLNTK